MGRHVLHTRTLSISISPSIGKVRKANSIAICLPGDERPVATLPDVQFARPPCRSTPIPCARSAVHFVPEAKGADHNPTRRTTNW